MIRINKYGDKMTEETKEFVKRLQKTMKFIDNFVKMKEVQE